MIGRRFRLPVQFETPFQMRIIGMASFRPSCPNDKQCDQQGGIRIWRLQAKLADNIFHPRVFAGTEPLSAFRAERAVVGNVCSAISTKHFPRPTLAAYKTPAPSPRASLVRV